MRAIIQAYKAYRGRARRRAMYRRIAAEAANAKLEALAREAARWEAFLSEHPDWERRCAQIELDNALWCWRQAKTTAERNEVLRDLGHLLRPYWASKEEALAEAWARQLARHQYAG